MKKILFLLLLIIIFISCENYYYIVNYKSGNFEVRTTCDRYSIIKTEDEYKINLYKKKNKGMELRESFDIEEDTHIKIKKYHY